MLTGRQPISVLLSVELRDDVQVGESGLQEALLVALHLYGSEPLGDRPAGRQRRRDSLVQQRMGQAARTDVNDDIPQ